MKERKKEKGRKENQNNADEQDAEDEQIGNNKNLVEMKSLYIIKLPNHAVVMVEHCAANGPYISSPRIS